MGTIKGIFMKKIVIVLLFAIFLFGCSRSESNVPVGCSWPIYSTTCADFEATPTEVEVELLIGDDWTNPLVYLGESNTKVFCEPNDLKTTSSANKWFICKGDFSIGPLITPITLTYIDKDGEEHSYTGELRVRVSEE
ncbi:MAG: hypothetical protein V1831_02055 [Candidatus Woesearchaeota archaeon]